MTKKPVKWKVQLIHGPNLNMLGKREPEIYGATTLDEIDARLIEKAGPLRIDLQTFQSNHEGGIVDLLQRTLGEIHGLIINPAAYTHTSIAIRDAILLHCIPVIEIHLSNIYKREAFRHKSVIADIATGQIAGFGAFGYTMALQAIAQLLETV